MITSFILLEHAIRCMYINYLILTGLLSTDLLAVTAALMAALFSAGGKTSVALAADTALDVSLFGEETEGWIESILGTTTEAENEVEGGVLLDGVVLEGVAVFELLASEDETLLIWWDTFLVLDLSLDVFDTVCWFDFEGNVLTGEGLDEDLH